jgi:hypothetical protein
VRHNSLDRTAHTVESTVILANFSTLRFEHKHGRTTTQITAQIKQFDSPFLMLSVSTLFGLIQNHSFIHQWLYSPLLGPGVFFSFVIFFSQTVGLLGRGISPSQWPLLTHRATQTQNKRTHKHSFPEWDSSPRYQRSNERRQFMP